MAAKKSIPARLHVLMRPETPLAVIIRRGPSKTVCTLGWNRQTDQIWVGQWMRARLFERRSDLSVDGRYLIYFAFNGRWASDVKGSWTAISLAPYVKALTLWPKGDCWQGGGLFAGPDTFWLNGCHEEPQHKVRLPTQDKHKALPLTQSQDFPGIAYYNAECLGIYFNRLQRDGWRLLDISASRNLAVFEKAFNPEWTLRKYAFAEINCDQGRGVYYDEHELRNQKTGETLAFPEWEWAEVDKHRLVWACEGKLWAGWPGPRLLQDAIELADFNGMAFESLEAPY